MPVDIGGGGVPELYEVAYRLTRVASSVASLGVRVQSIPLLGIPVALLISNVAGDILKVADGLDMFIIRYNDIMQALAGGDYSLALEEVLDTIFPDWRKLVTDPLGYLLQKLFFMFPHVDTLFHDPDAWLAELLARAQGEMPDWIQDPAALLEHFLGAAFAGIADFLKDPLAWLKTQIQNLLGVDGAFWDDPWAVLWDNLIKWIEDHLETFAAWCYQVGEKILFFLWYRGE